MTSQWLVDKKQGGGLFFFFFSFGEVLQKAVGMTPSSSKAPEFLEGGSEGFNFQTVLPAEQKK